MILFSIVELPFVCVHRTSCVRSLSILRTFIVRSSHIRHPFFYLIIVHFLPVLQMFIVCTPYVPSVSFMLVFALNENRTGASYDHYCT